MTKKVREEHAKRTEFLHVDEGDHRRRETEEVTRSKKPFCPRNSKFVKNGKDTRGFGPGVIHGEEVTRKIRVI